MCGLEVRDRTWRWAAHSSPSDPSAVGQGEEYFNGIPFLELLGLKRDYFPGICQSC